MNIDIPSGNRWRDATHVRQVEEGISTYTLGIATMTNSAACLFRDGKLVAAIENERLSRIKNDGAFPAAAIRECLAMAGISMARVGRVAVYWQPWRMGARAWGTLIKMAGSSMSRSVMASRVREMFVGNEADDKDAPGNWTGLFRLRRTLQAEFGEVRAQIAFHDHHLTHQLYAEAMRDWNVFASLSYDGGGEADSTVVGTVRGKRRHRISRHLWPNSLGHFYSVFTGFLGFEMLEGEYKMMGLAPHGEPVHTEAIQNGILRLDPNGRYRLNTMLCDYHAALRGQFHPGLTELFGPPRRAHDELNETHVNLASSVQRVFELSQQHVLRPLATSDPDLRNLTISGGCALNVTANGRLLQKEMFDEIVIPPAPHDAGCAIGAVMADLSARGIDVDRETLLLPYLGTEYDQARITQAVAASCRDGMTPLSDADLVARTADLLSRGLIVAWFQGRSEFGPRALGARSFLADPRHDRIREDLNRKIKKRELFRPFAPSVVEEAAGEYFEIDQPSPYMNIVAHVRDDMASKIPAVVHVDGTARVHTVSARVNPLYHGLIRRFGELTGIPVLLNTSFNIQEPIVQSPEEALTTFRASGVDALALDRYLVLREDLVK